MNLPTVNHLWKLARRPSGVPTELDFKLFEESVAEIGLNEVLVRVKYVSVDPYHRGRMRNVPSYVAPFELGDLIESTASGEVVKSRHPKFAPGDAVFGRMGWQEFAVVAGDSLL